jgi:hypothetical protein
MSSDPSSTEKQLIVLSEDDVSSVLDRQVAVYEQLQNSILRLLRIFIASIGIAVALLSIFLSTSGVLPQKETNYTRIADLYGSQISTSDIEIASDIVQLFLVISAIFLMSFALYTLANLVTSLEAPTLHPTTTGEVDEVAVLPAVEELNGLIRERYSTYIQSNSHLIRRKQHELNYSYFLMTAILAVSAYTTLIYILWIENGYRTIVYTTLAPPAVVFLTVLIFLMTSKFDISKKKIRKTLPETFDFQTRKTNHESYPASGLRKLFRMVPSYYITFSAIFLSVVLLLGISVLFFVGIWYL